MKTITRANKCDIFLKGIVTTYSSLPFPNIKYYSRRPENDNLYNNQVKRNMLITLYTLQRRHFKNVIQFQLSE